MVVWILLAGGLGCSGADPDTDPVELPDDTDRPRDTDVDWEPVDTGTDVPTDEVPVHTVVLHQWGRFDVGEGVATGRLRIREYLDGAEPEVDTGNDVVDPEAVPECDLDYTLTGVASDVVCQGCTNSFDFTLIRVSGEAGGCHDPFLPLDGELSRFALHPDRGILLRHNEDLDLWVPWFLAEQVEGLVTFEWRTTVGVAIEEEEE